MAVAAFLRGGVPSEPGEAFNLQQRAPLEKEASFARTSRSTMK